MKKNNKVISFYDMKIKKEITTFLTNAKRGVYDLNTLSENNRIKFERFVNLKNELDDIKHQRVISIKKLTLINKGFSFNYTLSGTNDFLKSYHYGRRVSDLELNIDERCKQYKKQIQHVNDTISEVNTNFLHVQDKLFLEICTIDNEYDLDIQSALLDVYIFEMNQEIAFHKANFKSYRQIFNLLDTFENEIESRDTIYINSDLDSSDFLDFIDELESQLMERYYFNYINDFSFTDDDILEEFRSLLVNPEHVSQALIHYSFLKDTQKSSLKFLNEALDKIYTFKNNFN